MEENNLVEHFLEANGFSSDLLKNFKLRKKREINPVVYSNGLYKNLEREDVCVADIIACDELSSGKSKNILQELNRLFNENGENYSTRSNSMLEYTSENILSDESNLRRSFEKEPITLSEVQKGKYVIRSNGMHRFTLLMTHYLNEASNCHSDEEFEKLRQKYTIPVNAERLDVTKTYSKYLLKLSGRTYTCENELDNNYSKTEKMVIVDYEDNVKVYSDEEIIEYLKNVINEIPQWQLNDSIPQLYYEDEFFREFVDKNFKDTCIDEGIMHWAQKNSTQPSQINKEERRERNV